MLAGRVVAGGEPVGGAFVRLLDGTGEFTAEVVSSASGAFRFFAAPGTWTLRALHRSGNGEARVTAEAPGPARHGRHGRLTATHVSTGLPQRAGGPS